MGNDAISSFLKDNRWIRKDCVSSSNAAIYSQNFQGGRLVSVNSVAISGMESKENTQITVFWNSRSKCVRHMLKAIHCLEHSSDRHAVLDGAE